MSTSDNLSSTKEGCSELCKSWNSRVALLVGFTSFLIIMSYAIYSLYDRSPTNFSDQETLKSIKNSKVCLFQDCTIVCSNSESFTLSEDINTELEEHFSVSYS